MSSAAGIPSDRRAWNIYLDRSIASPARFSFAIDRQRMSSPLAFDGFDDSRTQVHWRSRHRLPAMRDNLTYSDKDQTAHG